MDATYKNALFYSLDRAINQLLTPGPWLHNEEQLMVLGSLRALLYLVLSITEEQAQDLVQQVQQLEQQSSMKEMDKMFASLGVTTPDELCNPTSRPKDPTDNPSPEGGSDITRNPEDHSKQ